MANIDKIIKYYEDGSSAEFPITASNITNTLPVSKGGTGKTTFTSGSVLVGNGTDGLNTLPVLTNLNSYNQSINPTHLVASNLIYDLVERLSYLESHSDTSLLDATLIATAKYTGEFLQGSSTTNYIESDYNSNNIEYYDCLFKEDSSKVCSSYISDFFKVDNYYVISIPELGKSFKLLSTENNSAGKKVDLWDENDPEDFISVSWTVYIPSGQYSLSQECQFHISWSLFEKICKAKATIKVYSL